MNKFVIPALFALLAVAIAQQIGAQQERIEVEQQKLANNNANQTANASATTTMAAGKLKLAELKERAKQRREQRKEKVEEQRNKYKAWLAMTPEERKAVLKAAIEQKKKEREDKIRVRKLIAKGKRGQQRTTVSVFPTTVAVPIETVAAS